MKELKDLKIISLQMENVKRIQAIEIRPDGSLVQVTGENAQGKTSVFDGIWWALDGLDNVQKRPIRDGQEQAIIRISLGSGVDVEVVVTRTFQKNKEGGFDSTLRVESPDGARFGSPQAMLDKFLGALTFDPLAFSRMSTKEQFEQLKKFVPGFDFEASDASNKADFDTRTVHNRQAATMRAVEAQLKDAPLEEPKKMDAAVLTTRLTNSVKTNQLITDEKTKRQKEYDLNVVNNRRLADEKFKSIEKLKQEIIETEHQMKGLLAAADKYEADHKKLPALAELENVDDLNKQLQEVQAVNKKWELWDKRRDARERAEDQELKAKQLTEAIEKRNAEKVKAITESKLPVPGMTLGDGVVLMNGVPFEQSSDAEKLVASVKMAMATNPTLKLILIKDGSLLDTKSMELLAKMAEDSGYQVWIERVDGSGAVGFVIEDGRLKSAAK